MSQYKIITLLSDLGTRDASVPAARAALMGQLPGIAVVDVSHAVARHDLQHAAWLLLSAYKHFPAGAVHIIPVDVFAGDAPRILLAEKDGYFFIAPDNGLLPLTFGRTIENTRVCYDVVKPYLFADWIRKAGSIVAALNDGSAETLFAPGNIQDASRLFQPVVIDDGLECSILYIDRHQNVILDITRAQFDSLVKDRPFRIVLRKGNALTSVSNNYNDVPVGQAVCRFNDAGFMEIAVNRGAATSLLGLEAVNAARLRYKTVRIFF